MVCVLSHQASNGPGAWGWSHRMAWRHHHDPSQDRTSTIDPIPPVLAYTPAAGSGKEDRHGMVRCGC